MRLRYFLTAFFVSIPFWWLGNIFQADLEELLLWEFTKQDPEAFSAAVNPSLPPPVAKPIKNNTSWFELSPQELSARAVFIIHVQRNGVKKILLQKSADTPFPIASITKLMTAYVAMKFYDGNDVIAVSEEAVAKEEDFGKLKGGEVLRVSDLLWILLMESSNDAAWALAEKMGPETFIQQMNREAATLGMSNTFFSNPSGVDPDLPGQPITKSSARDIALLGMHILEDYPFLREILGTQTRDLYGMDGKLHHTLQSTLNGFADRIPRFVAAKTGSTPLAKQSLFLVQENPRGTGYIIYVLLGSDDRVKEIEKLVKWVNNTNVWRW